jgi:hypothetical protein
MITAIAVGFAIFKPDSAPPLGAGPENTSSSTPRENGSSRTSFPSDALVVRCRADRCGVFISASPGNEVLFNGFLEQGKVLNFDDPRMNLVVSDGSTADVYINGKLQPKSEPGRRNTFTIVAA